MKVNRKIIFLLIVFLGGAPAYAGNNRMLLRDGPKKEARFSGIPQDTGIDLDGDGLYEKLRVTTEIEVVLPGKYEIKGILRTAGDRGQHYAKTRKSFSVGKHTVEVDFDSQVLRRYRTDGPYEIELSLPECFEGDVIFSEDRLIQNHITGKYNWKQFKGTGAEFTGIYSDRAEDTDGDGKIDVFLLNVEVMAEKPGKYEIEGWLTLCGNPYVNVKTKLPQGRSKVALEYKTRYEFSCRYTGGYGVKSLKFSQNGVMKDFIADTGPVTRTYSYKDFWTPPIYFNPQSFREVTKNNWVGGLIQYLEVAYELEPQVKSDFPYMVHALLCDTDGSIVAEYSSNLVARPDAMSGVILFSGKEIRKSGKNGPYRLRNITLWGGTDLLDQLLEGITTKPYRYEEFGPKE